MLHHEARKISRARSRIITKARVNIMQPTKAHECCCLNPIQCVGSNLLSNGEASRILEKTQDNTIQACFHQVKVAILGQLETKQSPNEFKTMSMFPCSFPAAFKRLVFRQNAEDRNQLGGKACSVPKWIVLLAQLIHTVDVMCVCARVCLRQNHHVSAVLSSSPASV